MFHFPAKAAVNRIVPKSKIYGHVKVPGRIERLFVSQIEKIVWSHKLSTESTNLAETDLVREIEVFTLYLKGIELDEAILATIDEGIAHPILFRIQSADAVRFVTAHKRPSDADSARWVTSEYFGTDWIKLHVEGEATLPFPTALDLEGLYEKLLHPLLPLAARPGEALRDQIDRVSVVKKLRRDISRLQNRIHKEKQFNRKVDLNRELQKWMEDLECLEN